MDCIFCKIVHGDIKTDFVYEDEWVAAFHDVKPQAPIHILIIPKIHIERIQDISREGLDITAKLVNAAQKIAVMKHIDKKGYRLVINCGNEAGQEVYHVHLHLLGGRKFLWPPG